MKATQRRRQRWQMRNMPNANTGLMEKIKFHTGEDVYRTGYCPNHDGMKSNIFVGVNESGWVFQCGAGMKLDKADDNTYSHYFVNEPPEGK